MTGRGVGIKNEALGIETAAEKGDDSKIFFCIHTKTPLLHSNVTAIVFVIAN